MMMQQGGGMMMGGTQVVHGGGGMVMQQGPTVVQGGGMQLAGSNMAYGGCGGGLSTAVPVGSMSAVPVGSMTAMPVTIQTTAVPMTSMQASPMPMATMGVQQGGGYYQARQESDVFVEVSPVLEPHFFRGNDGTFILQVPTITVNISTTCNPPPPLAAGMQASKPVEQFTVQFPDLHQVVFDPRTQQPPGAVVQSFTTKRGAVLEVPQQVGLNARLKTNSPHGALVLEDMQVMNGYGSKVGANTMHWKLKVEGQLSTSKGAGNVGSHRLEVDLKFHFTAQLSTGGVNGYGTTQTGGSAVSGYGGLFSSFGFGGGGGQPQGMVVQQQQPSMMSRFGGGGGMFVQQQQPAMVSSYGGGGSRVGYGAPAF